MAELAGNVTAYVKITRGGQPDGYVISTENDYDVLEASGAVFVVGTFGNYAEAKSHMDWFFSANINRGRWDNVALEATGRAIANRWYRGE